MTQRRAKPHTSARSLVWLLLVAVALMGLTVTRQQALGPLHMHADPDVRGTYTLSAAVSSLASDWLSRWRQQQVFGHNQLRLATSLDAATLWPPSDPPAGIRGAHALDHGHDHDALERHHHAVDDASVVALDGAAEATDAAESSATGAVSLLPVVATPSDGLAVPALAARRGPWPVASADAFASRSVAPLLRPPTA